MMTAIVLPSAPSVLRTQSGFHTSPTTIFSASVGIFSTPRSVPFALKAWPVPGLSMLFDAHGGIQAALVLTT